MIKRSVSHFSCFAAMLIAAISPSAMAEVTTPSDVKVSALKQTTQTQTQNVILITADGLRWQEVFRGLDKDMLTTQNEVKHPEDLLAQFDAETTDARRARLMPFLWDHVAKNGQIFGNRDKGSIAHVTNTMWFSYPGYNEFLCGYPDDKNITSNDKVLNPNATVFEWLQATPATKDRVAAFGAWDVFPYIFNAKRAGFPVDGGDVSFVPASGTTPVMDVINSMRETTPMRWGHAAVYDSMIYPMAAEYLKTNKPRALFIGLGETDEWGHEGNYGQYLQAANRLDRWLKELWHITQSMPEYRDKTTFVFTTDHGRGDFRTGPTSWNHHGKSVPGAEEIFVAVWGPDTKPAGELESGEVTQSQVAATVAAALGYDLPAAQPKAAPPISQALNAAPSISKPLNGESTEGKTSSLPAGK